MKNMQKRLISLLFAVLIFCLQTAPVFAEETETAPSGLSSVLDSGGEAQDGDAVSTWDELTAWMRAHSSAGGSVRLTAPIAFDGAYAAVTRNPGAQPAILDLGEYGIAISGDLEMYCPGLTIRGKGGESASLRALAGGSIALGYIDAEQGANGAVLWQDEGGILTLEQSVAEGAVHFAERPIAGLFYPGPRVVPVMPGEDAADKLPEAIQARVFFEGDTQDETLPVVWNLTDEETAKSIAERRRTTVLGKFADMDTFGTISHILAFLDRPITFTGVRAENYKGLRMIDASFTCPASALTIEAEYSFDEELWITAEQAEIVLGYGGNAELWFCEPDEAEEGKLIWDTAQNRTLYLRMHWPDAANEADAYSDVLAFDGETMKISSDTGGNRGGGTDPDPPETLPPLTETPDPPPDDNTSGNETGSSGNPPPTHPDALPIEPAITQKAPLPPESPPANIPEPAADKADISAAGTESGSDKAWEAVPTEPADTQAAEQSESARAALAAAAPKPPLSNRAVGQAAAGTAATGCVIALTMTYSRWGGRLAAFLRHLLGKK